MQMKKHEQYVNERRISVTIKIEEYFVLEVKHGVCRLVTSVFTDKITEMSCGT